MSTHIENPVDFWEENGKPTTSFDIHTPVADLDQDDVYKKLREQCPVAWSPLHGGHWIISRHADVGRVLKAPSEFSSARNEITGDAWALTIPPYPIKLGVPEELDPPEFYGYRRLLNGILSPKVVQGELSDRMRHWVDQTIDEVIEKGECDLVNDITGRASSASALEWLGFPPEDWFRIEQSIHDLVAYPNGSDQQARALADIEWTNERIAEELALRSRRIAAGDPIDDVMTYLLQQEVDGEPITYDRVEGMVRLLIAGGVDTVTAASASAFVHLHFHPEQREELRADPSLWDTAVDEFIRRYPPVRTHARTCVADTEVAGCPIKAGERVLISERSACLDEQEFPRADAVVLDRFPNRHLAFGLGPHRCPGMHLARVTFRYLVAQVLERMPDYRVDESRLEPYAQQAGSAGWVSVPATFTQGPGSAGSDPEPEVRGMKVIVDHDICTGHARCMGAAPDVYELDDMGYNRMAPFEVVAGQEEEARRGAAQCPERAITIEE